MKKIDIQLSLLTASVAQIQGLNLVVLWNYFVCETILSFMILWNLESEGISNSEYAIS